MKSQDSYEINIAELFGICLLHWKKIIAVTVLFAVLFSAFSFLTFKAPPENSVKYRQIDEALTKREIYEERLGLANKSFEENQFYGMNPEKLMEKELTVAFELLDLSVITEQTDPTDAVIYAYYNLARTELIEEILSDSVLTRLQKEQLLEIGYNSGSNTVSITFISDNEQLIDEVLAISAEWFSDSNKEISEKTFEHKLSVLPISYFVYSREEAEEMTSTATALENIEKLEAKIEECNTVLSSSFNKTENWAVSRSAEEIERLFEQKKEKESKPEIVKAAFIGAVLGCILVSAYYWVPVLVKGILPGSDSVFESTGWKKIGRINTVSKPRDFIEKSGCKLLYRDFEKDKEVLIKETSEMTKILLIDANVPSEGVLGIIGDVSEKSFEELKSCLSKVMEIKTAKLSDRIESNKLCREADAIIFVGESGKVSTNEVYALNEIIKPLDKTPLGYIIV